MTRRAIGTVLAVLGGLLLLDAALTLAWREPVTWVLSRGEQERLERRLEAVGLRLEAALAGRAREREASARMAGAARALARTTVPGDPLGRISIPAIDARFVVVEGARAEDLRAGPGHYVATALPGERGAVGLAGHRTTHRQPFRRIDALRPGDAIVMAMPYGRFVYRVEGSRVVAPREVGVLAAPRGRERIVLTACHPLHSATERLVVFGRLARSEPRGAAA